MAPGPSPLPNCRSRRFSGPWRILLGVVASTSTLFGVAPAARAADPTVLPAELRIPLLQQEAIDEATSPVRSTCPTFHALVQDSQVGLLTVLCSMSPSSRFEDFNSLVQIATSRCKASTRHHACFNSLQFEQTTDPTSDAEKLAKLEAARDSFERHKKSLTADCCAGEGVHSLCARNFQATGLSFSSGPRSFSHYDNVISAEERKSGALADNPVVLDERQTASCASTSCIDHLVLHELGHACQYARLGPSLADSLLNGSVCTAETPSTTLLGTIPALGPENTKEVRDLVTQAWELSRKRYDPDFDDLGELASAIHRGELTGTSISQGAGVPTGCLGSYQREAFAELVFIRHWPLSAFAGVTSPGDEWHLPASIPLSLVTEPGIRKSLCGR